MAEALVEALLSEYAIVHRIDQSKDVGLDMICEWVDGQNPTQLLFGIQVKARTKIQLKTENRKSDLNSLVEYTGNIGLKSTTIKYWKGLGFPIFLFLVKLADRPQVFYKRYTTIVHGIEKHNKVPFYLATEPINGKFQAHVNNGVSKTGGFCRDLYVDHLRCQHSRGMLSGIDPKNLGLLGWSKDLMYEGVYDQYKPKMRKTFELYKKFSKLFNEN